jgi:hypothetical protein
MRPHATQVSGPDFSRAEKLQKRLSSTLPKARTQQSGARIKEWDTAFMSRRGICKGRQRRFVDSENKFTEELQTIRVDTNSLLHLAGNQSQYDAW